MADVDEHGTKNSVSVKAPVAFEERTKQLFEASPLKVGVLRRYLSGRPCWRPLPANDTCPVAFRQARLVLKYRHCDGKLSVRTTDDKKVCRKVPSVVNSCHRLYLS
jgi:hypothetical protein